MNSAFILLLALSVRPSAGEERPQGPVPGVTLKLAISTNTYDPSEPSRATVRCSAINKSGDPVEIRVGYDPRVNRLQADGKHLRWGMTLYLVERRKEEPKPVTLKPGENSVLFELSLDEILLQRPDTSGKAKWRWDWVARPHPPHTPIHRFRDDGFVKKTSFSAVCIVNDKWLSSARVELKVVTPGSGEDPSSSE